MYTVQFILTHFLVIKSGIPSSGKSLARTGSSGTACSKRRWPWEMGENYVVLERDNVSKSFGNPKCTYTWFCESSQDSLRPR